MARVDNKVALVTGAASGIGRATAILLAREGAQVIITDIDAANGSTAASETGHGAVFMPHDVSEEDQWREVIAATLDRFHKLDILVNNAAFTGAGGPVADPENTSLADWQKILSVTAQGPFLGCKHAIPAMHRGGGGSIVNISSAGALIPSPMNVPYGMAKAGVTNLTLSVAMHCAVKGYNIRCNAVYPGATRTPMLENLFETLGQNTGVAAEQIASGWARIMPLGRLAEPGEIANAVLFLASDEASYITAEQLVVDGGSRYPNFLSEA